jgi:ubiquinone/menaquinone biosynthesis C-methylase UbiE
MEKSNFDMYKSWQDSFWYFEARANLIRNLLKKKSFENKKLKILDVGCGTGANNSVLSEFGKVYSLDSSKIPLKICEQKGIKNLFLGDAQDMKMFKDQSFDIVCAIELIEHLPKDKKFLKECHRILKKKGFLIMTTPAFNFLWSEDDVLAHHQRRYTRKKLKNILSYYFNTIVCSYRYFFLFPFSVIIFAFQKIKKFFSNKKTPSLSLSPPFLNNFIKKIMNFENFLISKGFVFPFGVGLVVLCEKRGVKK